MTVNLGRLQEALDGAVPWTAGLVEMRGAARAMLNKANRFWWCDNQNQLVPGTFADLRFVRFEGTGADEGFCFVCVNATIDTGCGWVSMVRVKREAL